jgi:hypothetical protein
MQKVQNFTVKFEQTDEPLDPSEAGCELSGYLNFSAGNKHKRLSRAFCLKEPLLITLCC